MTVAAAAASHESEEGPEGSSRQLLFFRGTRKLFSTVTAPAPTQEDKAFKITIAARKLGRKTLWTARFPHGTPTLMSSKSGEACESYNWHIHARPVNDAAAENDVDGRCGKGATGGHTDNALKCGGATDEAARCRLKFGADFKESYKCSTKNQKGCEYGDLSGKLGKLDVSEERQSFYDFNLESLDTYKYMSAVLHCCATVPDPENPGTTKLDCTERVACGNLV